jgi:hypothetical protein
MCSAIATATTGCCSYPRGCHAGAQLPAGFVRRFRRRRARPRAGAGADRGRRRGGRRAMSGCVRRVVQRAAWCSRAATARSPLAVQAAARDDVDGVDPARDGRRRGTRHRRRAGDVSFASAFRCSRTTCARSWWRRCLRRRLRRRGPPRPPPRGSSTTPCSRAPRCCRPPSRSRSRGFGSRAASSRCRPCPRSSVRTSGCAARSRRRCERGPRGRSCSCSGRAAPARSWSRARITRRDRARAGRGSR